MRVVRADEALEDATPGSCPLAARQHEILERNRDAKKARQGVDCRLPDRARFRQPGIGLICLPQRFGRVDPQPGVQGSVGCLDLSQMGGGQIASGEIAGAQP